MNELTAKQDDLIKEFNQDSQIIGEQTAKFLSLVYPSYLVDKENLETFLEKDSTLRLQSMTFFRIDSCTVDKVDKVFKSVNERFEKLLIALYSIEIPIAYGIISRDGVTNLVLGVYSSNVVESVKTITQGILSGIDMQEIVPDFSPSTSNNIYHGILAGVPSLYVKEQKQTFSLASIMRSLNGQNYTLLFIAKPISQKVILQNLSELITVRDQAFAVSKRNIARSSSISHNESVSTGTSDGKNSIAGQVGGGAGASVGAAAGALVGTFMFPGTGTAAGLAAGLTALTAGTAIGGAVGGGLGAIIGNIVGKGKTHSDTYSKSVSDTITNGDTISGDIQNGFALELMNYADNAIDRLKGGQNNGIWQTAIAYSAESTISRNIIRACLSSELSKLDMEKLPMLAFEPKSSPEALTIPNFLDGACQNPLCSYINSAELGLLCTVPTESVPDFELRLEKKFPLIANRYAAKGRRNNGTSN